MVYRTMSSTMFPNGTAGVPKALEQDPLLAASHLMTMTTVPVRGSVRPGWDNYSNGGRFVGENAEGDAHRHSEFVGTYRFELGDDPDKSYFHAFQTGPLDLYGAAVAAALGKITGGVAGREPTAAIVNNAAGFGGLSDDSLVYGTDFAAMGAMLPTEFSTAVVATSLADSAAGAPQAVYNDPSLTTYWHLKATTAVLGGANVASVWDDYRGAGVIVGVIDDGVEYTHPDLAANYALELDYDARDGDDDAYPSDSSDKHGTTVAGVIAAALDNGAGGAGVAPEATLAGYRIGFGANGSFQQIVSAFQWMASVDVANNSWSFGGFLGDNFLDPGFAPIGDALSAALTTGREGLGTVVVFAAGNERTQGQDVNYHGLQNSRGTIAAAATDSSGNITWFSTPGAALLVAAPGLSIPTTDRVGSLGYASGDYATMSGTSFSSPLVSGIAALMLEANPGLGWRDVQEILASTAVQTGSSASWSFNGADNWNGGAMHVSHDYGFGLVDAYAAVRLAESWRGVSTSANEWVASSGVITLNAPVPDVGSLSSTVMLPAGLRIDHVEIDVALLHSDIGQLVITLTSPDGTESVLLNNPATSQDDVFFTFSTTRDWGELSGGNWTLTVSDTQGGASATLTAWALRAYGDVVGNDTYVYSEEFSVLAVVDPTRLLLSDGGGTDTINTAAIASNTILDLRSGHASVIDGQSVTIAADTLIENVDSGDGNDQLIGNAAANSLRGWSGNDTLLGGAGDDTLVGGSGNDRLDGGRGADTMIGGFGDDQYYVDNVNDSVVELSGEGSDLVYSSVSWTLAANVERLYLTGSAAVSATGNELANTLYGNGNSAANVLSGGLGNDAYKVGAGDTVVEAPGAGTDTVYSYGDHSLAANVENLTLNVSGAATLTGNELANYLRGNVGGDVLTGFAGNDSLDGGQGADTMIGGVGDDQYHVDNANDSVAELSGEGSDIVYSSVGWTLAANVERLYLTGSAAVSATGNELANTLYGNGNSAANVLSGGLGNDTYKVGAGDTVVEAPGAGTDTVYSYGDHSLAANVENLTLNVSGAATLTGNELANYLRGNVGGDVLTGFAGNDSLDGGQGADTMIGGVGDDQYHVDNANDSVAELSGEGSDIVYSSVGWTLAANVERLYLTGSAAVSATGNELANTLYGNGNSAANVLSGGLGNDTYKVGAGDTVVEAPGAGTDTVYSYGDHSLAANVENLTLNVSGAATLTGNELANYLRGNVGGDVLTGFAGNDSLDGGQGADTMIGGVGDDQYHVDNANDSVAELSGEGSDIVYSSVGWTLAANVERLYLTGSAAVSATGNELANTLYGNGNSAANVLSGGLGNDTYKVGAGDTVVEAPGAGTDTVYSYGDHSLAANVENLTLNVSGAATLTGNELNNALRGNAGNDTLAGGLGNDTLTGGAGSDIIRFDGLLDALSNLDTITDFNVSEDTFDLAGDIFSSLLTGLLSIDSFLLGNTAVDADDYVIYDSATGALYYDADGNGAGAEVQFAALSGGLALTNADFLVT
jgi:Ca2+-binding RTX toxin-like protein